MGVIRSVVARVKSDRGPKRLGGIAIPREACSCSWCRTTSAVRGKGGGSTSEPPFADDGDGSSAESGRGYKKYNNNDEKTNEGVSEKTFKRVERWR